MNKILVTYATNAGSTAKVAQAVADELAKTASVDVLPLDKVTSLEPYFAIVLGAPMILGWASWGAGFPAEKPGNSGPERVCDFRDLHKPDPDRRNQYRGRSAAVCNTST